MLSRALGRYAASFLHGTTTDTSTPDSLPPAESRAGWAAAPLRRSVSVMGRDTPHASPTDEAVSIALGQRRRWSRMPAAQGTMADDVYGVRRIRDKRLGP